MTNKLHKNIQFLNLGFRCRCEVPAVWPCFHQHNEVELMFIKTGYVTYRFGGSMRKLSAGETVCFWSSVPHQIVDAGQDSFFEWLTIPLGLFIQWQLPEYFSSKVIQGEMIVVAGDTLPLPFAQWEKDLSLNSEAARRIVALEAEARLRRLALSIEAKNL